MTKVNCSDTNCGKYQTVVLRGQCTTIVKSPNKMTAESQLQFSETENRSKNVALTIQYLSPGVPYSVKILIKILFERDYIKRL